MKLVMTGSSSYLAGVILPLLEADNDVEEIIGLDLKPREENFKKLRFIKTDIRAPEICNYMQGCDVLVHLAYIVMPIRKMKDALDINIEGSKNVFRAALKAGIKKIVYSSSCAAYGAWPDNPPLITEEHPLRGMPDFYYSFSKAKVEEFLDGFEKENKDLIITRIRPCIFLGPSINNLMRDIVTRRFSFRIVDKECKIQFAWDEDVAKAFYLAIKNNYPGAFNIAGDGYITMDRIIDLLGVFSLPVSYFSAKFWTKILWRIRFFDQLSPGWVSVSAFPIIMSCEKAKNVMGWKPDYDSRGAFIRFLEKMKGPPKIE